MTELKRLRFLDLAQDDQMTVREVVDRGNIIVFRSSGGTIFTEVIGNRIQFGRVGGVYWLKADTSTDRWDEDAIVF